VFIAFLAGAAACPVVARAQHFKSPVRIGFLPLGSATNAYDQSLVEAFRRGLRQIGLVENRDVALDVTWISGDPEKSIAEVIRRGIDILVPCGFSDLLGDLGGKLIDLSKELSKPGGPIDYFWHTDWPDGRQRLFDTEQGARSADVNFRPHGIGDNGDVNDAIAAVKSSGGTTLIVQPSPFTYKVRGQIAASATRFGIATLFAFPIAAREGALIAYGPDYVSLYQKAPLYIERIIQGTKPADLPVEQPTKVELVVNLSTAKALKIELPLSLLIRADELVE
jgi:putative ABC transport system substrate-binding protein